MRKQHKILTCAILAGLLPVTAIADARAQDRVPDPRSQASGQASQSRLVPDAELQKLRGGLRIGGLEISLGADIRTYMDGELVLHTTVNWGENGAEITQSAADSLTPVDVQTLSGSILNRSFSLSNREGQQVFLANDGQTALFHRTDGALQNFLINGAQGANISQTVNANIGVEGYQDFAEGLSRTQLSNNISDTMANVTNGAVGF